MSDSYEDEAPAKRRFRIMHLTMTMLALLFVAKLSEVVTGANQLIAVREAQASSHAEEEAEEPAEKESAESAPAEEGGHGGGEEKPPEEEKTLGEGKLTVKQVEALKQQGPGESYTQSELDLLQNLAARRDALAVRERELVVKAKVLEATEKRINAKLDEMKTMQAELTKVLAQYNEKQNGEIQSLVKIYESMKPGDAAAIFNEMDMPILLEVIDKMSERKVAPVLAGMDPKRARDVTQELAEMRRGRAQLGAAAANAAKP